MIIKRLKEIRLNRIVKRFRKSKLEWTILYVLGSLCSDYFEKVKYSKENIIKLEKILFIMQAYSLEKLGVPLLVYEIYYYNGEIYLKYLSDMIRIVDLNSNDSGDMRYLRVNEKYGYKDILEKEYMRLTEVELDNRIKEIIENNKIDPHYLKFEECPRKSFYRKCARFQLSRLVGIFVYCGVYPAVLNIVYLFAIIITYFVELSGVNSPFPLDEGIAAMFFTLPSWLICYLLLKRMTKPTKFEIELENKNQDLSNDNTLRYKPRNNLDQKLVIIAKNIENSNEVESNELRIFEEVCNMVRSIKDRNPDVNYVVLLERTYDIEEIVNKEKPPKLYYSSISVFLTRNRVILERKKDAGEWPGILVDLVKVKGMKKREFYIEDNEACQDDLEYETNVYCNRADEYYENKEESEDILRSGNVKKIEWID